MIQTAATEDLPDATLRALRSLFEASYEDEFTDDDWEHALGGTHVLFVENDGILAHASVVPRKIVVGDTPFRTGYVEAVATAPGFRGRGHGTAVMLAANEIVRRAYQLGALCTGKRGFYERLGWERWLGATYVRSPSGVERTPEEDGNVMVLRTHATTTLDRHADVVCDWRSGDVW